MPVIALIISAQIIIAGDDDIISVQLADFLLALRIGSLYAQGTQINGKFLNLILPVVNQRGRADDDGAGQIMVLMHAFQPCNDLKCFSQTHIISEDTAESIGAHCFQPLVACFLVITQDGIIMRVQWIGSGFHTAQLFHHRMEGSSPHDLDMIAVLCEIIQLKGMERIHLQGMIF